MYSREAGLPTHFCPRIEKSMTDKRAGEPLDAWAEASAPSLLGHEGAGLHGKHEELVRNIINAESKLNILGAALLANFGSSPAGAMQKQLKCVQEIAARPNAAENVKLCGALCTRATASGAAKAADRGEANEALENACKIAVSDYTDSWVFIHSVVGEEKAREIIKELTKRQIFERSLKSGVIASLIA